jgi:hypothetical protein
MNFVDELAKSSDADIQCAAQNEEDNGGDAQVDSDGNENGGKDSGRHHYLRSVLRNVVKLESLCIATKIKEGVCWVSLGKRGSHASVTQQDSCEERTTCISTATPST